MGSSVAAPALHRALESHREPPHPYPPLALTGANLAADQRPSGLQQEHRPPLGSPALMLPGGMPPRALTAEQVTELQVLQTPRRSAERLGNATQAELQASEPATAGPSNATQAELNTTAGDNFAGPLTAEQATELNTAVGGQAASSLTTEQAPPAAELQASGATHRRPEGNPVQAELNTAVGPIGPSSLTTELNTALDRNPIVSLDAEQTTALNTAPGAIGTRELTAEHHHGRIRP